jgi:hypothetical protein
MPIKSKEEEEEVKNSTLLLSKSLYHAMMDRAIEYYYTHLWLDPSACKQPISSHHMCYSSQSQKTKRLRRIYLWAGALTVLLDGGTTVIYQLPKLRLLSPVLLTRHAGQMFPFSLVTDRLWLSDGNCECLQGCREGGKQTFFHSPSWREKQKIKS